ncbi:MAG: hypothetical protein WBD99_08660 [Thermodesulfobacteriota bacterium]
MTNKTILLSTLITLITIAITSCYAAYPGGYGGYGYAGTGALYYSYSGAYYDYPGYYYPYSRYRHFHDKHGSKRNKFYGGAHERDPWFSDHEHKRLHHGVERLHEGEHQRLRNSRGRGDDGRGHRR